MQYASQSRLKNHLLASSRCRLYLEAQLPSSTDAVAPPDGHVQAPSVRVRDDVQGSVSRAELCLGLMGELNRLAVADDQEIYDVVASFVEPLPLLRQTLQHWHASLPCWCSSFCG